MNYYDWLLDSHKQWKHCVLVCMVEDDFIGYNIAIIPDVSCMTEPAEIFGNIFLLSDYRGHITFKGHILLVKWSVGVGTQNTILSV